MTMNETLRATMQRELADSRKGFGGIVGLGCFLLLCFLGAIIPGVGDLVKNHTWPSLVILALSMGAGWFAGSIREIAIKDEIQAMDDDTLKFRHDQMSRKKLKGDVIAYLIIALVVAYFIFRK